MIHPFTLLKGAGLGAGMMYFFDPLAGNRRRALVRDQIVHACTVCNQQARITYRDAGNRLQGASAEISNAMQSSDQPLIERVQEGVTEAGRTLGMQGRTWSPTAKAAAMLGGAGLVASFMNKRDLAALAFGVVGLSFVAKELADQENMRSAAQRRFEGNQEHSKSNLNKEKQQKGESEQTSPSQSKQSGKQSRETNENVGMEASVPAKKKPAYDL
jgi:hypothetical protein